MFYLTSFNFSSLFI